MRAGSVAASSGSGPVATLQRWWQKLLTMLKLFFSTIIMPLDPAKDDKGTGKAGPGGPGSNVRRINPGGSSHTQFGSGGGGDDNDFMRRGRFRDNR
eukprot:symbB.v1.2.030708.t1/scaffold3491.1/size55518/4